MPELTIYKFAKNNELPRTSVRRAAKTLGLPTSGKLSEAHQQTLLEHFGASKQPVYSGLALRSEQTQGGGFADLMNTLGAGVELVTAEIVDDEESGVLTARQNFIQFDAIESAQDLLVAQKASARAARHHQLDAEVYQKERIRYIQRDASVTAEAV